MRRAGKLAAEIGQAAVVATDNRYALQDADAVVLALRFGVLKGVIDEIADALYRHGRGCPEQPCGPRRRRKRRHASCQKGKSPALTG